MNKLFIILVTVCLSICQVSYGNEILDGGWKISKDNSSIFFKSISDNKIDCVLTINTNKKTIFIPMRGDVHYKKDMFFLLVRSDYINLNETCNINHFLVMYGTFIKYSKLDIKNGTFISEINCSGKTEFIKDSIKGKWIRLGKKIIGEKNEKK